MKQALFNVSAKHRNYLAPNNDPVIPRRSECIEELDHGLALLEIGKPAAAGADIVGEMGRVGGAGNDGGHGQVAEKKFQEELGPGGCIEIGGPFRHLSAANLGEQGASS